MIFGDSPQDGKRRWRLFLRVVLGLGVGGFFLYLSLREVAFHQIWSALQDAVLIWLFPLLLFFLVSFWLRSLRWRWMFPRGNSPTFREAFDAFMIGALGNNLMPGRLGDLLRGAVLGRHLKAVGTSGALASIVLEKVLDGLVVLAMLGLVLALAPFPEWLVHTGFLGLLGFGGALIGLLVLSAVGSSEQLLLRVANVKALAFLVDIARRLTRGLHGLRNYRRFAGLLGFSFIVWGIETGILFLSFNVFQLSLPVEAAIVTVVLLAIGTMLPAAPGFVGTYQYFVVTALSLYEISPATAMALAISLNLLVIFVTTVTGMAAVLLEGGLTDTFKQHRRVEKASPEA